MLFIILLLSLIFSGQIHATTISATSAPLIKKKVRRVEDKNPNESIELYKYFLDKIKVSTHPGLSRPLSKRTQPQLPNGLFLRQHFAEIETVNKPALMLSYKLETPNSSLASTTTTALLVLKNL